MNEIKPLFERVDHISIICDREQDLYTLHHFLIHQLKLAEFYPPSKFPVCRYYEQPRLSSNVFVGNLFIHLIYFYQMGGLRRIFLRRPPRFSSLIFETNSLSEARPQLRLREIRYSDEKICSVHSSQIPEGIRPHLKLESGKENLELYKTHYIDPYIFTSAPSSVRPFDYFLSMSDKESFVVGLKSYYEETLDIQKVRESCKKQLEEKQKDYLSVQGIDRIVFSTTDSMIFSAFFDQLFAPLEPPTLTEWMGGDCPIIKLEENQSEGITHLDIKVSSLLHAKEILLEQEVSFIEHPDYLALNDKRMMGLRLLFKE